MKHAAAVLIAFGLFSSLATAADAPRTNVVLILVDDLGATDLHCEGSPLYETPHIDRLASQSIRFTSAYSACTVCSPTRGAVITGKYPARLHLTDYIPGHEVPTARLRPPAWTKELPPAEVTLAEVLQAAGYATCHLGKWHLGPEPCWPQHQGFEVNLGGTGQGQPPSYFDPYKIATLASRKPGEYLTDRLTDEAVAFIRAHRDQPFFLNFWQYAVHTPLAAPPAVVEKYKAKVQPGAPQHNATYAAMVEKLDDSVGRVLATLDELKLTDHTLVIFTSDNGGQILNEVTSNLGLRAGKGSAYEGGVRVPLYVRLPGQTQAGKQISTPVISIDLAPTIVDLTGTGAGPVKLTPDGESLRPLFHDGALQRSAIYWHYPHYHPGGATPYSAVRSGDYKLVEFYEDNHRELYNLARDPQEKQDLSRTDAARAEAMHEQLAAWRTDVGAQAPLPNPKFNPAKDKEKGKEKGKAAGDGKQ